MDNLTSRIAPAALALLILAGCGGTKADPHQRFVDAVDHVCAQAVARHGDHQFPVSGFDPDHPSASQLPAVGDYFARYGGLPRTVRELHALRPPAADAHRWRALLGIADQVRSNAQHQISAARARQVATFVQTEHASRTLIGRLNTAGARFGFASGSACEKVFG